MGLHSAQSRMRGLQSSNFFLVTSQVSPNIPRNPQMFVTAMGEKPAQPVSGQEFCLKWNNHQATLVSILEQQYRQENFVDVTLAVEGVQLMAHKMVLCACSPYFASILTDTPDKHPIVILKDVSPSDMRAILEFMYR